MISPLPMLKGFAVLAVSLLGMSTPILAADLEGPVYHEHRRTYVERPHIVEKRIIEHHHYYERAPAYREHRIYVEPRVIHGPRHHYTEYYYPRRRIYAYAGWRPRHFIPRHAHWRHYHHGW